MKVTRRQLRRQLRRIIQEEAESFIPDDGESSGYSEALLASVADNATAKAGWSWWWDGLRVQFLKTYRDSGGIRRERPDPLAKRAYFTTGLIIKSKDRQGLHLLGKIKAQVSQMLKQSDSKQNTYIKKILSDEGPLNQWRIKYDAQQEADREGVYGPGDELPEDMKESPGLSRRLLKQMISEEILKSQKG